MRMQLRWAALRLPATFTVLLLAFAGGPGIPAHARPPAEDDPPLPSLAERYTGALPLELRLLPAEAGGAPPLDEPVGAGAQPASASDIANLSLASRVVYQSLSQGAWNIVVARGTGEEPVRLTDSSYQALQPKLNRGATHIAYTSNELGTLDIYVVDVPGFHRARVGGDPVGAEAPSWSPDGTRLAFQSWRDGQAEIYVMNANGTNFKRLTFDGAYDGQPAWSPGGRASLSHPTVAVYTASG